MPTAPTGVRRRVLKILKPYIVRRLPLILLAILMIAAQAWCDLSLPAYTSAIVNTGIASGGVEEDLPAMLPGDEYLSLYALDPGLMEASYAIYDPSAPGAGRLASRFPDTRGAYYLKNPENGLAELMSGYYSSLGEKIRYGSPMAAYIIRCYRKLGVSGSSMQMGYILRKGGRMLVMVLMSVCAAVATGYLSSYVGASLSRELRRDIYGRVLSFSPSEFDRFSTASLITRTTGDVMHMQMLVVMSMRMIAYAPIMAVGGIIRIMRTNASMWWIIALASAVIIAVMAVLYGFTMPRFKLQRRLVDRINLVSREVLTGRPVIRAFGSEPRETARFEQANKELMQTGLFVNRTMAALMPAMNLVMNMTTLVIVWVGAGYIGRGVIRVGDMMAFITYATQVIMAFLTLGMISLSLPRAIVSAGRIAEVLGTNSSISDPPVPGHPDPGKDGVIEFDHVGFRYPGASEEVLHDITFTARPGQTTAIIGATGCGKSTLVGLIPRLFDVTSGRVLFGGVDVRELSLNDLRGRIGFVPQRSILFSGTIGGNIAFSDQGMDTDRINDAARAAQAEDFISHRAGGLDSPIAQGGSNISGGQKQRLSIARAIAKAAPVYILDDSFSALDYKTDRALRRALSDRTKDSTVIIVAQRISTVMNADSIIVLDEGRIAGIGTHSRLMAECPEYREIALSQLSKEELTDG